MKQIMRMLQTLGLIFLCLTVVAQAEKEWTVMVYIGADNNLEPFAIEDINEMEQVGSTSQIDIVVQVDRHPGYDYSNGDWRTTRRYYITKDADTEIIGSDLIADLGELNTGNPQVLTDFVNWAMTNYPANRYFLILWDHGSGWHKKSLAGSGLIQVEGSPPDSSELGDPLPFLISQGTALPSEEPPNSPFDTGPFKAMCSDETNGSDMLMNNEIQSALSGISSITILGMDACLMGMIEVAYEFKDQAGYLIASEESEPADGWPYHYILSDLASNPSMLSADLCSIVVADYGYSMTGYAGNEQTLSAVDLSQIPIVAKELDTLCTELEQYGVWSQMHSVFPTAERFGDKEAFYDLYDMAHVASTELSGSSIINAANELKSALQVAIVAEWHESGHPDAHGLSIYFPQTTSAYDISYHQCGIDFPNGTGWYQFLTYYWEADEPTGDVPEPNNVCTQAGLPLDTLFAYQSFIPHLHDEDWWLINSGIAETVEVYLDVPSNANFNIDLYNNNLDLLESSHSFGNGVDEYISYYSSTSEYMYLNIAPVFCFSTLPYVLHTVQRGHKSGGFLLSYDDNDPYGGYFSTTAGDVIGVSFDLPDYPMEIERLWIYFYGLDGAGTGDDGSFYLLFWDNLGQIVDPDSLGLLTPQSVGWNYLDLTEAEIKVYSNFFAGVWFDGVNTPTIGYDNVFRGLDYYYNSVTEQWSYLDESMFFRFDVSYPDIGMDANEDYHDILPGGFTIEQNFPNPFNTSTLIRFSLRRSEDVCFEVFNILGQLIKSEELGLKRPGIYSVSWDGTDSKGKTLPSGVYFYRIKAGDNVDTRKMLLLK